MCDVCDVCVRMCGRVSVCVKIFFVFRLRSNGRKLLADFDTLTFYGYYYDALSKDKGYIKFVNALASDQFMNVYVFI